MRHAYRIHISSLSHDGDGLEEGGGDQYRNYTTTTNDNCYTEQSLQDLELEVEKQHQRLIESGCLLGQYLQAITYPQLI